MLFIPFQLIKSGNQRFDVERNGIAELPLKSSREMNCALDVMVEALLGSRRERFFNQVNHLRGNGYARFGAGASAQQKDDVFRAARHVCSQEPRSDVVHSWH